MLFEVYFVTDTFLAHPEFLNEILIFNMNISFMNILCRFSLFLAMIFNASICVGRSDYVSFAIMLLLLVSQLFMVFKILKKVHIAFLILTSVLNILYFIIEVIILICYAVDVCFSFIII